MPPTTQGANVFQTTKEQPPIQHPLPQPQFSPTTIEIGTIQAFLGVGTVLFGMGFAWGTLKSGIKRISTVLIDTIAPDLKDVRERFMVVEDRVDTLWKDKFAPSHSPRQLNDRGTAILNGSGIKEVIDSKKK